MIPRLGPFSIVVVPHSGKPSRTFCITNRLIASALTLLLLLLFAAVRPFVRPAAIQVSSYSPLGGIEGLKQVIDSQEKDLQALRSKTESLEETVARFESLKDELHQLLTDQVATEVGLTKYLSEESKSFIQNPAPVYRGSFDRTGRPADSSHDDVEQHLTDLTIRADELNRQFQNEVRVLRELVPYYRSYPSAWPVQGTTTSAFGSRRSPITGRREAHQGLDIASPYNKPVTSSADGVVISAGWSGGLGRAVRLDHGGGLSTLYAHLYSIKVKKGDRVSRGQIIGTVGSSGLSTGPHLHFGVYLDGIAVNPEKYLADGPRN